MHLQKRGKRTVIAEMNMIPLIDISLILLIIFMVITPSLVQSQIRVNLPSASSAAKGTDNDVVKIQISAKGEIAVNGRKIPYDTLEKELILRFSKAAEKTLLVEADKTVPVEKVVHALDLAKKLGAGKTGIAVTDREEK
ncbi:MAG: biopolymer transporter ExbD [Elusimicrobiales bacterium]|nr:biopolymer transporter ExbD [Elusimicrobiales bacterium]